MVTYSVTITDEQDRVLRSWLVDPQAWLTHAFLNKVRQRVDAVIVEETDLNVKKLTEEEKMDIIKNVMLPTKEERKEIIKS